MMTEDYNGSDPVTTQADPRSAHARGNGAGRRDDHPLPGINVSELVAERNWTALAGLGLIGVGILYVLQDTLNVQFHLWSLLLILIGGGLMADAWRTYDAARRTWAGNTRNRMIAGALIALVGLVGMMDFGWWGLMLLVIAGWLGYDSWQRYEAAGRIWTDSTRNRAIGAAAIGVIGLFGFLNLGGAWLLLIIIGGAMLYRRYNRR